MSNRITEKLLFSPTNIPGCTLWLDAADPNTVVGTSPVTNWKDKSGKGYDLSSSGGTPQYVNYGPGMSIYLNNAYLAVPTIAGGVNLANYSFFIVSLSQTAVINQTAFSSATPGIYNYGSQYDIAFFIDSDSPNQRTRFYSGGQLVLNSIPTTTIAQPLNLMSYTGNSGGAFSSWVNGNTGTTNTSIARAPGTTSFSVGGNWNLSAWVTYANVVCNIYEVVVYTTVLTTAERQQVEGYLTWKWGLQGSLPPTHPYKNLAPSFPFNTVPWTMYNAVTPGLPYSFISNRISIKNFSPLNITGLQLWFDAADPNGNGVVPANGATLSTWVDKSGNARNATVAPGKIAGTYSTSNRAVNFAASNTGYVTSYTANPSLETMFVVFNNPSPSFNNNMVIGGPQGARSLSGGYAGGGAGVGAVSYLNNAVTWAGMASMPAGSYTSGTTVITTGQVNGLTTSISQNGGTIYSNTTTSAFSNVTTYLGTDYTNPVYYYIGFEMEVIFYNSLLSLLQRQSMEGYLAWKWGLQGSLPSNHPFRSYPPPP
jgi:hypothetical protein